jgi:hypothetical protein
MSELTMRVRSAVCAGLLAVLFAVLVAGAPGAAAAASADDAERAQIAAERAAIEARYQARERECMQRFVVTSCIDDAKRERRQGLDALKARQLALDEARRRARSAERSSELAAKAAEDAKRERAARAAAASAPAAVPHEGAASALPRLEIPRDRRGAASPPSAKPSAAESAAERQAREARNRAAFEARQRQAAQHREEVLDNTTRQMSERAPAASLPGPVPASSAASAPRR